MSGFQRMSLGSILRPIPGDSVSPRFSSPFVADCTFSDRKLVDCRCEICPMSRFAQFYHLGLPIPMALVLILVTSNS